MVCNSPYTTTHTLKNDHGCHEATKVMSVRLLYTHTHTTTPLSQMFFPFHYRSLIKNNSQDLHFSTSENSNPRHRPTQPSANTNETHEIISSNVP